MTRDPIRFARVRSGAIYNVDRLIRLIWTEHGPSGRPCGIAWFAGGSEPQFFDERAEYDDLVAACDAMGLL